jgi:hypothetical protein
MKKRTVSMPNGSYLLKAAHSLSAMPSTTSPDHAKTSRVLSSKRSTSIALRAGFRGVGVVIPGWGGRPRAAPVVRRAR